MNQTLLSTTEVKQFLSLFSTWMGDRLQEISLDSFKLCCKDRMGYGAGRVCIPNAQVGFKTRSGGTT
jgi:hypothetical protein